MSNKPGVSGQVISPPSGGRALHGLGETFAPDRQTGRGNLSVPIALPPGRDGFTPTLDLVDRAGAAVGPEGLA